MKGARVLGWGALLVSAFLAGVFLRHGLHPPQSEPLPGSLPGSVPQPAERMQVGDRRPEFSQQDLDGELRHVAEWDGQVLVMNFWASWCRPCLQEIPMLVRFQGQFLEQGVRVLGLAMDEATAARKFADRFGINYPVLTDAMETLRVLELYGNDSGVLPYTVVVDRQGKVTHMRLGELQEQELIDMVSAALAAAGD